MIFCTFRKNDQACILVSRHKEDVWVLGLQLTIAKDDYD